MTRSTSQTPAGKPSSTTGSPPSLTRAIRNRSRQLERLGKMPGAGEVYRAMAEAVNRVLAAEGIVHDRERQS
jgi:hypothetical protein